MPVNIPVEAGFEKKPLEMLLPSLELVPTSGSPIMDFNEVFAEPVSPNPVENEYHDICVFCEYTGMVNKIESAAIIFKDIIL